MSIFGDLDIASASDDPFKVDAGTYTTTVTGSEVKKSAKGNLGLSIEYTITDEDSPMHGRKVSEWKNIPSPNDPNNPTADESRAASFLKQRLLSLGVPEDRMNSMAADDLLGTDAIIVVKEKDDYTNVTKVTLPQSAGSGISNPFAN